MDTQVSEHLKVQFRAEFYSLSNHLEFTSPMYPRFEATVEYSGIDPNTGRGIGFSPLTQAGDAGVGNLFLGRGGPRRIQLALKFSF